MPYNVAAGNSSGYNYASGRLDHQTYWKAIDVERDYVATTALDKVLARWWREAVLVSGLLPVALRNVDPYTLPHSWYWPGREHVDPAKEAQAATARLTANTTTLAVECAKAGLDWESVLEQRAKELAMARELGLAPAAAETTEPADAE